MRRGTRNLQRRGDDRGRDHLTAARAHSLLPLGVAIAVLTVGAGAGSARPAAVLTLEGPKSTRFGHTVDFAGRLVPGVPGRQIRLYSAGAFVAATDLRKDGTYLFKVQVGRPGPFRAVTEGAVSRPVTVRVVPVLETHVVGRRIAGEPLAVGVRLQPPSAGRIRVRVLRDGRQTYGRVFRGSARLLLGTTSLQPFRVDVETLPAPGYARAARGLSIALRAPRLSYGSSGPLVFQALRRLSELGYVTPSPRTTFDEDVLQSVYAFEKAQGLERIGVADAAFWQRLAQPRAVVPRHRFPARHIEVDKTRQILLLVRDGKVALVVPVSTAGISGYYTPEGAFAIYRKVPGYDPSPLGVLYKPMYFYGGYAVHGNPSVPPYPASHGCIRVPNFVIERLYDTEPYGETVYVYS
jgi:peptidoglycan hydrolase-like protein with peptidoglycan-binding domain